MKQFNKPLIYILIFLLTIILPGCELIFGIFEAGFWMGIIVSALLVFILIFIVIKLFKALMK